MNTQTQVAAVSRPSLVAKFANKYSVDPRKMLDTLKATAFKQRDNMPPISDEQMMALLIVADQYGLNPFTKEIYAYPDKNNGIVPVVGVDGWSRIMNEHPQMDGLEFNYSDETVQHKNKTCNVWIDCVIYRKDRSRPIVVRERFEEVVRSVSFATPWDSHPNRMHRHKALIQGARIAFGFTGIYDEDEASRIVEKDITAETTMMNQPTQAAPASRTEAIKAKARAQRETVVSQQESELTTAAENPGRPGVTFAQVAEQLNKAKDVDLLDAAADLIGEIADESQREELGRLYQQLREKLGD